MVFDVFLVDKGGEMIKIIRYLNNPINGYFLL